MKHRSTSHVTWGLSLIILLLLAGCDGGGREVLESTESPLPTPGAVASASSPIQTPLPELPDWNAEPGPGKAILRGRIEIIQPTVLLGEIFLAEAVPTSNPDIDLLEMDEERSPRASINRSTGEFIFLNVEPGKYGLIAWEPMSSSPVNDPATGETFFIELPADQVTDVGTLYFP